MTTTNPSERDDDFRSVMIEFLQALTVIQRKELLEKLQSLQDDPSDTMVKAFEEFVATMDIGAFKKRRAAVRQSDG